MMASPDEKEYTGILPAMNKMSDRMETLADSASLQQVAIGDAVVTLLGTAHVSRLSVAQVGELLAEPGCYDAVAVELCESRYQAIMDPDALSRLDLFAVIREKRAHMVAANLALSAYQQRLADQVGVEPGAEQREAIKQARRLALPVLLIDREIGVTLKRVARRLGFFKRINLFAGLLAGLLSREQVTEDDIEALKQGDVLETAFSEFAASRKDLYEPLISERDSFMAIRLRQEMARHGYRRVLAVVGAGHCRGLAHALTEPLTDPLPESSSEPLPEPLSKQAAGEHSALPDAPAATPERLTERLTERLAERLAQRLAALEEVPAPGLLWRAFPWLVVMVILGLFAYGFTQGPELGWDLVWDWVLINGGLSALGAALAGAHPLTVLGAFCAAPLTSLNPTIGAGMVTGGIELFLRRPRVGDFRSLREDVARWSGWWRNRVARILLVFVFSTLGSALGTYIAGFHLVGQLFG
jgi:pheromone shutdown protein TraB